MLIVGADLAVAAGSAADDKTTVVQSPISSLRGGLEERPGLTVNQIYEKDSPGVVFIRAEVVQQHPVALRRFPQSQRGEATGSGLRDRQGAATSSPTPTSSRARRRSTVNFGDDKTDDAKIVGTDTSTDVALLKVNADKKALQPLSLGDSSKAAGRRPGGRDRQPVRPRPHGHDRHRERAAAQDRGAQRLHDRARDPDRRRDQPRQLRRPADRQPRPRDRHQLADRDRRRRQRHRSASASRCRSTPPRRSPTQLKKTGKVEHAFLGITGVSITTSMSQSLNLPTDKGVLVQRVDRPGQEGRRQGRRHAGHARRREHRARRRRDRRRSTARRSSRWTT